MRTRRSDSFTTITVAGQVLPADLLQRIADKDKELGGLGSDSYHLSPSETISEATSRAWNKLVAAWGNFRSARSKLPANDPGTTITRERWLLPLFQELGYGRLPASRSAVEIDGKGYAISHWWSSVPIHLVGVGVSVDKLSARIPGAARSSPHSLVQELLNRSEESLWGFVSNGLQLRILRDNQTLVRLSYVEFDLEAMMDGEAYSDFVMLWLLCHQSRVEADTPPEYWLEKWSRAAQERGVRALDHLRDGVKDAISELGSGFLAHRSNRDLRERLRSGALDKQDYYRQLLRLVYRLLFLFVGEDRIDEKGRSLIFDPNASQEACDRYTKFYSTKKLRTLAERRHGSRHSDLYLGLQLVMEKLGSDTGCNELALPALGSFLFSKEAIADLSGYEIANHDLLDAVRALAFATDNQARRQIDYKNLGSEELGSVYESLLELHPQLNVDAASLNLSSAAGHERKTTGSYYTHDSLVQSLLDSALDPVLVDRERNYAKLGYDSKEHAILDLKVCDPACGSGHFLIASAHRLAKRLAAVRTGDDEPSPEATRHALRDVVGRCLYGVDINPMAVELCKVSLWMEALEPGKPLSFLDHHILCGNSLLGTTPALMRNGIPDDAFKPIEEDDRKLCAEYKKQNKRERQQETLRGFHGEPWEKFGNLATSLMSINEIADDTIDGIRRRQERYASLVKSSDYRYGGLLADAWCAAFVWKKRRSETLPYPITEEAFRRIEENPFNAPKWMEKEIKRLADQYQLFHWHLAFPDVFRVPPAGQKSENELCGWNGGFDVSLGNPPWERVKLQAREWFSSNGRQDIAKAPNAAARKRLIETLKSEDHTLHQRFLDDCRKAAGEGQILRESGLYPLCGRGDINLYAVFAESMRNSLRMAGLLGCVLPTGIATDDTTKFFFQDVVETKSLVSVFDFENRDGIFPDVHRSYKFCLFTCGSREGKSTPEAEFLFFALRAEDLKDPQRRFRLSAEDIKLLNPISRTCPVLRLRKDLELATAMHSKGVLLEGSEWEGYYIRLIHLDDHSEEVRFESELPAGQLDMDFNFRSDGVEFCKIIEPKMVHHFDHRYATFGDVAEQDCRDGKAREATLAEHQNAAFVSKSRYWVTRSFFREIISKYGTQNGWLLGYRDIARSTDVRTCLASVIPETPTTVSMPCIGVGQQRPKSLLASNLSSICLDYCVRLKVPGTHLTWGILKQLPVLSPEIYAQQCGWANQGQTLQAWLVPRVLELTYTAWDLEAFARDCGWSGSPFRWDEARRFLLRSELDAAFFHLYGLNRDDTAYILETFPIVRRKEEQRHGEYRTKRVVLEIFDEMANAIATSTAYRTRLEPPPADPRVAHPLRTAA